MKIGIDMDGVVSDFGNEWGKLLEQLFGPANNRSNPVHFDDVSTGYTLEQVHSARNKFMSQKNAWYNLKPLASFDAETSRLLRVAAADNDVFFITNRFDTPGASPLKQTKHWLWEYALILTPNVLIAKDKGPVASVLQLDTFIDDSPKNLIDVLEARPKAKIYLADSSHNQDFNDPRFPRVKNLKEFLKLILEAN